MADIAPFDVVPMVSIHPNKVNLYSQVVWPGTRPKPRRMEGLNKGFARKPDVMSPVTARKVHKATDYLLFLSQPKTLPRTRHGKGYQFQVAFVTLTLPSTQIHSDAVIKSQCLNQFLVEARRRWHVKNYIWRAEKQLNGNIHFHVLCDKFIPWSELRDTWNRICNKLNYVSRYRDQMVAFHNEGFKVRQDLLQKWDYKAQVKAYQTGKANDWSSPNSTDIHSVRNIANLPAYLAKYFCKKEQNQGLTGRMWGCNYELSNLKGARLVADNSTKAAIDNLMDRFNPREFSGDYFKSLDTDVHMLREIDSDILFSALAAYIFETFGIPLQLSITNTS